MTFMLLLACTGMVVGCFLLLRLTPVEFADGLFGMLLTKPKTLKDDIYEITQQKKRNVFWRTISDAQEVLYMTGRESRFSFVCALSLLLFVAGAFVAFLIGNYFLAPVLALGFLCVPFWYVKITANHYKRDISGELEQSLQVLAKAKEEA